MSEWWHQLNLREKYFLALGAAFLIALLFYFLIWSPFTASIQEKQSDVAYQRKLVSWMSHAKKELTYYKQNGKKPQAITLAELPNTVNNALRQYKINAYANAINESAEGKVTVTFKQIPFDKLIHCISMLWKQHSVKVTQIEINALSSKPGLVSCVAVFELNSEL